MKIFFVSLIILILTFFIGVEVFRNSTPNLSLETISKDTAFYDGMNVEIESYIQFDGIDQDSWRLGQQFEKPEYWTFLKFDESKSDIESLKSQLRDNFSLERYKRAKVVVKGVITDNCKKRLCCFGKSLSLKVYEIRQISPVEDFYNPVRVEKN
ncbi:MAG TPA: hypothetical protein PKY59_16345 [Pyrinomonadaceae bacterium]|nr:hypothetical protein [Pyrinomonadaceae bacterium]